MPMEPGLLPYPLHRGLLTASVLVAIAAVAALLNLLERVRANVGSAQRYWKSVTTLIVSVGLWSACYLTFLAVQFPEPFTLSVWVQWAAFIVCLGIAWTVAELLQCKRGDWRHRLLLLAAPGMGTVIMHVLELASVRAPVTWNENPYPYLMWTVATIVGIAAAVHPLTRNDLPAKVRPWMRRAAPVVLGLLGILIQQSGIAAATLGQADVIAYAGPAVDRSLTAVPTVAGSLIILGLAWFLAESERRFQHQLVVISEPAQEALFTYAREVGTLLHLNPAAEKLAGAPRGALVGKVLWDVLPEPLLRVLRESTLEVERSQNICPLEFADPRSGAWYEISLMLWPDVITATFREISDRKRLEQRIHHQATHDPLTDLGNRSLFREQVKAALRTRPAGASISIFFIDLDDFKMINDIHGHTTGDLVLVALSQRLADAAGKTDCVARLGGDEFAVLKEQTDRLAAEAAAARMIAALDAPVKVQELEVRIGASIGVVVCAGPEADAEQLLRYADVAMYHAKAAGKGQFACFDTRMYEDLRDNLMLKAALQHAVNDGQLTLHYQPIVNLADGTIRAVEALVRWQHPDRGLLMPAQFLALAEESGLIHGIGEWVLREACRQVRQWQAAYPQMRDLSVGVNLSAAEWVRPGVAARVEAALRDTGLSAVHLILEITESSLLRYSEALLRELHAVKALGVRLCMDDFGTGYSSLAYLRQLPLDMLKIDKSFVGGLGRHPREADLLEAIIHLAGKVDLPAVAEGIEHPEQAEFLRSLNCPLGQGFLFARPQPPAALAALFAASQAAG